MLDPVEPERDHKKMVSTLGAPPPARCRTSTGASYDGESTSPTAVMAAA